MGIVVSVVGLSLTSCQGKSVPEVPDELVGSLIVGGADKIVMPGDIESLGDLTIISDAEAPFLRVFNRKGQLVQGVGTSGDGPGEYRSIGSLALRTSGGQLFAFDTRQQRINQYVVSDSGLQSSGAPLQILSGGSGIGALPSGDFVSIGAFSGGALKIFSADGTKKAEFGTVPFQTSEVSQALAQQIIAGRLAVNPDGSTLAIAARWAGRIDIYDLTSGERVEAAVPVPFTPEIVTRSNGAMSVFVTDGSTQFGYVDVAASRCCIYGLFSGRTRRAFPGKAFLGDYLHIFDWKGKLLRITRLDKDLGLISVDADGARMTGVTYNPEPGVYTYDL